MIEKDIELYKSKLRQGARNQYVVQVSRFANAVKGNYSKERLLKYIERLQTDRYAASTIVDFTAPALKKFYRVMGIPWPLNPGELPKIDDADIQNIALDNEVVYHLIDLAKTPAIKDRYLKALLVVSTIYGTRRIELCRLNMDDVKLSEGHITIRTAKGGQERTHIIPHGLLKYLDVRFRPMTQNQCSRAWSKIEKAVGFEHFDGVGWHAVRRSIVRELELAEVPQDIVDNFMRWRTSRFEGKMRSHYFNSKVVSFKGIKTLQLNKGDSDVDNAVFSVHPFLERWLK